jgi:hypothetical protein
MEKSVYWRKGQKFPFRGRYEMVACSNQSAAEKSHECEFKFSIERSIFAENVMHYQCECGKFVRFQSIAQLAAQNV